MQNNESEQKLNEDRVLMNDLGFGESVIFGVLDGHGTHEISDWLAQSLPVKLRNDIRKKINTVPALKRDLYSLSSKNNGLSLESVVIIKRIIRDAVLEVDRVICQISKAPIGGSTASFTVILRNYAFVVNIGDSRTLVMQNDELLFATKDHDPADPKEQRHIHTSGGEVVPDEMGTARVNGIWALSRAFGDCLWKVGGWREYGDYNDRCANYDGVNGVMRVLPDIKVIYLDRMHSNYTFMSATDGLYDVYDNDILSEHLRDTARTTGQRPTICQDLVQSARYYKSTDDITATFIKLAAS